MNLIRYKSYMTNPDPAPFVPALQRARDHGWTTERQRLFVELLAAHGSVRSACAAVGLSTTSAYKLRMQPGARSFRAAWDAALAASMARLMDLAMERIRDGVEQPVFYRGEQVGTRPVYSDRLLMFMLARPLNDYRSNPMHQPEISSSTHDDALGKALLALARNEDGIRPPYVATMATSAVPPDPGTAGA